MSQISFKTNANFRKVEPKESKTFYELQKRQLRDTEVKMPLRNPLIGEDVKIRSPKIRKVTFFFFKIFFGNGKIANFRKNPFLKNMPPSKTNRLFCLRSWGPLRITTPSNKNRWEMSLDSCSNIMMGLLRWVLEDFFVKNQDFIECYKKS